MRGIKLSPGLEDLLNKLTPSEEGFRAGAHKASGFLLATVNVLVLLALFYNFSASWRTYRGAHLFEAATRAEVAASSAWIFDSGLFEPLPVFALKVSGWLGAAPGFAVSAQGMLLFCLITLFTLIFLRKRFGPVAAMMGAIFVAGNPYMGYYGMQGDSHLFALFFKILFWTWLYPPRLTPRRAALAGLWGGLACLSRADSAWFILLCAAAYTVIYRTEFKPRLAALALGVSLAIFTPYLVYQKVHFGNALHAQEVRLKMWAVRGTPQEKEAGGQPLSASGFVFRDGPAGAAASFLSGLGRVMSYELPRAAHYKLAVFFAFIGFYAAFAFRKYDLVVFFLAALLPVLPLAATGEGAGFNLRFVLAPAWALFLAAGLGMQRIADIVDGLVANGKK